jgi:hypothetical protein
MIEERRSDVRLMCADMVEVRWKTVVGQTRRATALLEDISRSGACLQLESPLPLGVELHLSCPRCELVGTVRYCVYREIGYFVGVEFDSACPWSPKDFRPQHLLNLRQLVEGTRKPRSPASRRGSKLAEL